MTSTSINTVSVLLFIICTFTLLNAGTSEVHAQAAEVRVVSDGEGMRLQVDGKDFMVIGMNWDYFPIGTNYSYSLWTQSDETIRAALDHEMSLLQELGVNAIRQYVGVPPRWVTYIYERYGIYTVLNHSMGRYGVTINGVYYPSTDYSDPETRASILAELKGVVNEFQDVPGVLMWLLGNENNYGLVWKSAETEALPEGERNAAKARYLYSLFGEATRMIKSVDMKRPVAMANGDLQYIDIIAEEVTGLDIFGTNVYRGISFRDAFQEVNDKLGLPIMYTEFGADAFDAREMREDQVTQARYLIAQWQEIYEQSSGKGLVGNSIGGLTFQFSDGWWKFKQDTNLDIHDVNASWPNDAYPEDYVQGENNMNEEWWGICAKGPTDAQGLYKLYPRAAYYALQKAYHLDQYGKSTDLNTIRNHFNTIRPAAAALAARSDKSSLLTDVFQSVRVSGVRIEMSTISTGGDQISTPDAIDLNSDSRPSFRGFDHLESFYAEIEARPSPNVSGSVAVNVLGNVPENPINEIFYENRGRVRTAELDGEQLALTDIERIKVYRAQVSWDSKWFTMNGFYRTGHYHWGYEGDFFGLYQEANYGPNIDLYNGNAPLGVEIEAKKELSGLKIALGPELWWGANPALLLKYQRQLGPIQATAIYQEDLDDQGPAVSSFAIPLPPTRKATLHLKTEYGPFGIEVGGIWSGDTKTGQPFQIVTGSPGNYTALQDYIKAEDAFGGKAKLTLSSGRWNWYAQGTARGLVADGGPTSALTYTGWRLKDNGTGNQYNVITGLAVTMGNFQVAPNFLWQKPIVGPMPADVAAPARPRNVLDDPFAVRANRETTAGELLITYDPTPATWMYAWDSDIREDAPFAASVGFVFRHHPTTQDAAIGILADGRTTFAFPGATPERDLWETYARIVSKLRPGLGMIANIYAGTGEPNGDDDRLIHRYGADVRFVMNALKFAAMAKVNDWGPYDYHRDFNQTFPLQLVGDLSYILGTPAWFDLPQTRIGLRGTWRSLDQYSPRYCPGRTMNASGVLECDPDLPGENGSEWEIRTYIQLNIGM